MRPRITIRGCVGPSVRPSVRNAFVKIAENGVMQDGDASYVVYTALLNPFRASVKQSFYSNQFADNIPAKFV